MRASAKRGHKTLRHSIQQQPLEAVSHQRCTQHKPRLYTHLPPLGLVGCIALQSTFRQSNDKHEEATWLFASKNNQPTLWSTLQTVSRSTVVDNLLRNCAVMRFCAKKSCTIQIFVQEELYRTDPIRPSMHATRAVSCRQAPPGKQIRFIDRADQVNQGWYLPERSRSWNQGHKIKILKSR